MTVQSSGCDGLRRVLSKWQDKLADLEDMKARSDLTRDWGECSLINARSIVEDLAGLAVSGAAASTPAPGGQAEAVTNPPGPDIFTVDCSASPTQIAGGQVEAEQCSKCEGTGKIEYEITNHGERNERVKDKCNKCGGTGTVAASPTQIAGGDVRDIRIEVLEAALQWIEKDDREEHSNALGPYAKAARKALSLQADGSNK